MKLLLVSAMAYDNRRPGRANTEAWLEASERGRWTFQEALDAVHAHYAESTEFLMPGHITARLRSARQRQAPARGLLPPAAPASPETRSAAMDAIRRFGARWGIPRDVHRAGGRARGSEEDRRRARDELDASRARLDEMRGD